MVNSAAFAKRLEKVMDYYELSAAAFADRLAVGRSSISHILSGRNKPSLDFVLKVIGKFPEVELYWLLNGKENFPMESAAETMGEEKPSARPENQQEKLDELPFPSQSEEKKYFHSTKPIHKIVIFYKDGTFEAFQN